MKKTFVFSVMFLCLSIILTAQSSNDAQRIVGTWVNEIGGERVVFNANGTMSGRIWGRDTTKFAIFGEKIVIMSKSDYRDSLEVYDFRISNDGKALLIFYTNSADGMLLKRQ
jgi:hypothetical protein